MLVVEDLHWADSSTLEFLAAIAKAMQGIRCLLVVTFRTGSKPDWTAAARLAHLVLTPLKDHDSLHFLANLPEAVALSDAQRQQVLKRAEGNPFVLEELARAGAHSDRPL